MKKKTLYRCASCGFENIKWLGKCPTCNSWNTLEEVVVESKSMQTRVRQASKKPIKKLLDVVSNKSDRIVTGINEFDRVMGGGIVKDSISIITARPGAGKSTLLLQISDAIAKQGYKVIYASGEESDSQIKNRADRILDKIHEKHIEIVEDHGYQVLETKDSYKDIVSQAMAHQWMELFENMTMQQRDLYINQIRGEYER